MIFNICLFVAFSAAAFTAGACLGLMIGAILAASEDEPAPTGNPDLWAKTDRVRFARYARKKMDD